jgi:hypothetical protein
MRLFDFEPSPLVPRTGVHGGARMAACRRGKTDDDFYPTDPSATLALCEREVLPGVVWEPACGDGRMSRVIEDHGQGIELVMSSDLYDRGYEGSYPNVDFLNVKPDHFLIEQFGPVNHIVTNPPYNDAEAFIWKSLDIVDGKVCMLLRTAFLESSGRHRLFTTTPLARVYQFSRRIQMFRNGHDTGGSGMIAFAWFIWDKSRTADTEPVIRWIP